MFVTDHFPALGFQTRIFFIPKATMKTKCKCGEVFVFKVSEAMKFIGCHEREQALKTFVTTFKGGCVGRLTFPTVGQLQAASMFKGYCYLKNSYERWMRVRNVVCKLCKLP